MLAPLAAPLDFTAKAKQRNSPEDSTSSTVTGCDGYTLALNSTVQRRNTFASFLYGEPDEILMKTA